MEIINSLGIEAKIALATSIIGALSLLNDKVRGFVLSGFSFMKDKAELKLSTAEANDTILETLMNRINSLSDEYVRLSELNTITQKENFQLKTRLSQLEYECTQIKSKIENKCLKDCLKDV